ncbi:BPSS1780 family membrane protein [Xylophilus sp.]|uniref:BPSS1780 family membrane protein n=1 Tax=Xylophilus sp. TaxID=2653893 RepID=UPI0013B80D95|nr:BPSS1780 family membrane protein [Xylophilus sp.]KAF1043785.1 MAG: hypothetical protein GAK38_03830 [Xylophilus sp.]
MKLNLVPARTGFTWVRLGLRTFWHRPLALAGLFLTAMVAMSLASLLPLVGTVLALALLPATTLAMVVASAEAVRGKSPTPSVLLAALRTSRERMKAMATLGLLYAAGFLLVMGVSALIDGGQFASLYLGGGRLTPQTVAEPKFQAAVWITMALYLPLSLMFWHAPALVHWHGVSPVKSLFFSAVAGVRNIGAFTLYGIGWMGVFLGAGLAVSVVATLLVGVGALTGGAGATFAGALMVGGALTMAAMFFTSIVFTFRDCFEPPERSDELSAERTPA